MAKQKKQLHIAEGTAYYPRVHTPNPQSDAYETIVTVDKEEAKKLKQLGLSVAKDKSGNVKDFGDKKYPFKFKRKNQVKGRDGETVELGAPKIVDSHKNEIDRETLIGNGSYVKVAFYAREYTTPAGNGVTADLVAMQVLKLVEYKPRGQDPFYVDDRYDAIANKDNDDDDDELTEDDPF
jgi:hypothetical protein